MNTELTNAINVLTKALQEDKDYYLSWQANIAMAVYDKIVLSSLDTKSIHEACNKGAISFLDLLIQIKPKHHE